MVSRAQTYGNGYGVSLVKLQPENFIKPGLIEFFFFFFLGGADGVGENEGELTEKEKLFSGVFGS